MTRSSTAILAFPAPPPSFATAGAATCLSPADMAHRLRATYSTDARCFAEIMHEESAWASARWDAYWAEVLRLV